MAMEVQEESQILLGKILVMINAIAESDLLRLMKKKAEESIYDIFLWTEGDFEFVEGQMPDQKMVPLSLDVTGIIMEGMRRYDEWQLIRQRVPDSSVIPEIMRPLDMDVALRPGKADRSLRRRPALDRGDRPADPQRRVHRLQAHLRGPPQRARCAWSRARPRMAPPVPSLGAGVSEVDHFLQRGRAQLKDDPQAAYKMFKVAYELDATDGRTAESLREAEREIKAVLERDGVTGEKMPELAVAHAEPDAAPVLAPRGVRPLPHQRPVGRQIDHEDLAHQGARRPHDLPQVPQGRRDPLQGPTLERPPFRPPGQM